MRAQKIGLYVVGGLSVVFGAAFVAIMNIFVRAFFSHRESTSSCVTVFL